MKRSFRRVWFIGLVLGAWTSSGLFGQAASASQPEETAKASSAKQDSGTIWWDRFRGPNGQGQADAQAIPIQWTEKDYLWKIQLPGVGHSSPVVWAGRVLITAAQEDGTLTLLCLDACQGQILWQKSRSLDLHHLHPYNSYASSTPAVDSERVYWCYAQPKRYVVEALRLQDGQPVWQVDLGAFESEHGFGASPIVADGLIIVPNEQDGQSSVVALDAQTGKLRWRCPRRTEKTAYATPCVYRPAEGPVQVIVVSWAHGPSGIELQTGKPLWELPVLKYRVVGSPLLVGDILFCACGVGGVSKQMIAVRPGNPATGVKAEVLYEVPLPVPYVCTPVARGELLFAWADKGGMVTCLEAPTGKILWREKVGGDYFSSPIRVGNRLYNISRDGHVVVLAAEKEFQLLAKFPLGEPTHATPAIANGIVYIRTLSHLMALGPQKPNSPTPPASRPSPSLGQ